MTSCFFAEEMLHLCTRGHAVQAFYEQTGFNFMANKNLSESIADKIKNRIIKGEYSLGKQLPNEQELCDSLNVSRTTVREAIKLLVSRNVLKIERGKGTFVAAVPGLSEDPFGLEFINEEELRNGLAEFRRLVEPDVCALAAEHASPEQIGIMEQQVGRMNEISAQSPSSSAEEWIDEFINQEIGFHVQLYKSTGNILFERMGDIIARSVILNCTMLKYRQTFDFEKYALIHNLLFQAIADRDAVRAKTMAVQHTDIFSSERDR